MDLTPTRAALLRDIKDGHLYFEARHWWHNLNGQKRSVAVGQAVQAGWVTWEEIGKRTRGQLAHRIYARLTDEGRSVLEEWESRNG